MQTAKQIPRYPMSKQEAGPHFWRVLQSAMLAYPEQMGENWKTSATKYAEFIKIWLESFPCDSCVSEGKDYLTDNPPPYKEGRDSMRMYGCEWQNSIREKLGKQPIDCEEMIASTGQHACTTCNSSGGKDLYDVSSALNGIKRVSKKIIRELSIRENVPEPKLVFQPCPSMPDSAACARIPDNIIFINPKKFQLKSLIHEFMHTALAYKGRSEDEYTNEEEMDRLAYEVIENEFKYDKKRYPRNPNERDYADTTLNNSGRDLYDMEDVDGGDEFDKYYDETEGKYDGYDDESEDLPDRDEGGGVLEFFEKMGIYKPFASILKISEKDLNEAHTPEIIGNLSVLGSEYFMSPFGALMASTLGSAALMALSAMTQMPNGDRKLVNEVGAHLLWNGIRYLNPKLNAAEGAFFAGQSTAKGDLMGLVSSLSAEVQPQSKPVRSMPVEEPQRQPTQAISSMAEYESMATNPLERMGEQAGQSLIGMFVPLVSK